MNQRRLKLRHPGLWALLAGTAAAMGLLIGIEGLFLFVNRRAAARVLVVHTTEGDTGDYILFDHRLGYRPAPNARVSVTRGSSGRPAHQVMYTFDELGRRRTPASEGREGKSFIAFFGGSFAFGEGVNDDEALANQVALRAPEYSVYNFGFSGYGPQQALVQLNLPSLRERLPNGKGLGVAVLIPGHVRRAVGSMRVVTGWGRHFPNYVDDGHGNLIRRGSFHSERYRLVRLYDLLAKEQVLRYFNVDIPLWVSEEDIVFTCRLLGEVRDAFEAEYGSRSFFILLYPSLPPYEVTPERLVATLEAIGLETLDYSGMADGKEQLFLPLDGHPTATLHARVAERLVVDLGVTNTPR